MACDRNRQIARGELGDARAVAAEALDLARLKADAQAPIEHRDGGRNRALGASHLLQPECGCDIARIGHAMCDDGRFERHHRAF
jgi:hypothetical protein